MVCTKLCRYFPTAVRDMYQCASHRTMHTCTAAHCKTRVTTSEGEFCYLTGRQGRGVECLLYDFTHSCTRVVLKASKRARTARRETAKAKRNRWLCPMSDVTEIIKRLYCIGNLRESTAKMAALRTASKLSRPFPSYKLEDIMKHMRVGVYTAPSSTSSPWVAAVSLVITEFANRLQLQTTSSAAAAAFPVLFTAVIASKMVCGERICGVQVIPKVQWVGTHSFSDVHFNQMNISCRAMSGMWRRIKTASVQCPSDPITCKAPLLMTTDVPPAPNPAKRNRYFPCLSARFK